jgi:hypothetical protein
MLDYVSASDDTLQIISDLNWPNLKKLQITFN